jgi:hypothetical protein
MITGELGRGRWFQRVVQDVCRLQADEASDNTPPESYQSVSNMP